MAARSELIEWFCPEERLPKDDESVLLIQGGDPEVWMGYWDGEAWLSDEGFVLRSVLFWAAKPEGPLQ